MYIGRDFPQLTMISLDEWDLNELLFYHHAMSQLAAYLNAEGASLHAKMIQELESRGPIGDDSGGWDHSSTPIYD
ncbi:hypothetical protein NDK47_21855 [Brevibacillus ruminantium]|uniref:Cytosolic protein n=1 Tax=Brevibacillus ruminantium TaxID=2950604 RepID=A0ABY4WHD1_9BACL|nr:hypothetical protein [Brevibacillus ruminantium]USG64744.1 hypothetical protein NDK47_21855 [Brevibacillus ruminantium]